MNSEITFGPSAERMFLRVSVGLFLQEDRQGLGAQSPVHR